MKKYLILILLILLLVCCNDTSNNCSFITSPIDDDFSYISEPRARWNAYNLNDYAIKQSWSCECFAPNGCDSYIINDTLTDVKYKISKDAYFGRSEEDIYKYIKHMAITVDEAFDLIDKYKNSADIIEVEYDSKFGYPTKLFIDINIQMADEEIIRRFSNLQKIIN